MQGAHVDLASLAFWGVFTVALILLTPIARGRLRSTALAAVNVVFLWLLLGTRGLAALGIAVITVFLGLRAARGGRLGPALVALAGALGLFVLHKLPPVAGRLGLSAVSPVLGAIGFSYVLLRLVEVGRAVVEGRHPPPGIVALVNYLLPFHMLAAGPIQAYDDFVAAPEVPPAPRFAEVLAAVELIVQGLFKKFVLAYALIELFSTGWRARGAYWVFEVNAHYVWLYLDFSAYSDIALGIGKLLGVATPVNFDRPYLARNLTDFWERWHISLSTFIRRNLFLPLQMALVRRADGRRPLATASLAIFTSFLLCGAWHGLTLRFLAWGLLHAVGLVLTNVYKDLLKRRIGAKAVKRYMASRPIRVVATTLTFEFVAFSVMIVGEQWKSAW